MLMPKSNAQSCKEYRDRLNAKNALNKVKKKPKTSTERVREHRLRKRAGHIQTPPNPSLSDQIEHKDNLSDCDVLSKTLGDSNTIFRGITLPWAGSDMTGPSKSGNDLRDIKVNPRDSSLANQNVVESSNKEKEQFQDDNDDEFKSLSAYARNSFYDRDDFDTFGSFVASELRGLRNDVSLIRKVKKKIQLAIIEAYDTHYESETTNMYLPSTSSKVPKQQTLQAHPFQVDSVEVKVESAEIDLTPVAAVKAENVAYEGY